MGNLRDWARQPTTVAGFSAVVAAIAALVLHQVSWGQALPVLAGAVMSMILPDNTSAQVQARELAGTVVSAISKVKENGQ